jgi:hypothetical protein
MMGKKRFRYREHRPGARVRSHYRAPWYGTVLRKSGTEGCVYVEVTHDRCGKPMRKALTKHLHCWWLSALDPAKDPARRD